MTTNNMLDVGLSGSSGTGTFVGSTSPTLVTPNIGAATATSLAFSPTTGGIIGTTTNDNASASYVGELIQSVVLAPGTSLTTTTLIDLTSIALTAGDWDVWGNYFLNCQAATNVTLAYGWTNSTSTTMPDRSLINEMNAGSNQLNNYGQAVPYRRYSLSGNTTIYLSVEASFTGGTCKAAGAIYARRVR